MRPIPKFLLIHSCILSKEISENVWGGKNYRNVALSSVRFEPVDERQYSTAEGMPKASTKMFYDCRNSVPRDTVFATGDIIRFGDEKYTITKVSSFYDEKRLHHIEVFMI